MIHTNALALQYQSLAEIPAGGGSADLGHARVLGAWAMTPAIAAILLLRRFSTLSFRFMFGVPGNILLTFIR